MPNNITHDKMQINGTRSFKPLILNEKFLRNRFDVNLEIRTDVIET